MSGSKQARRRRSVRRRQEIEVRVRQAASGELAALDARFDHYDPLHRKLLERGKTDRFMAMSFEEQAGLILSDDVPFDQGKFERFRRSCRIDAVRLADEVRAEDPRLERLILQGRTVDEARAILRRVDA